MGNNNYCDEMTPKERSKALIEGKPFDRIPCNPFISDHAARVIGIKVSEYQLSAENLARGQIAAYRTYGHDSVGVGPGLAGIPEAVGSKVALPQESAPYLDDFPVKNFADLDNLIPPDPQKDGRLPLFLEALQLLVDELGEEVPISTSVAGPFTTAANIRGTENFLRDLYYQPEFAHKLLRFALESTIPYIEEAAKLGVNFGLADPTASGSLISPKQFKEFVYPYLKELTDHIKRVASPPSLHICGNTKKIWQAMADTGAGTLSLDNEIDLAEAKEAVGDRVVLVGNIRPTETMYLGTPDDVVENAKECLRKAYDSPKGYILSLGCGLPIDTKPENIHALVGAARKYGRYPLTSEF
ncbi:MAG: uroporphyrinogen decarboxylase family protein [Clostridia bacterium]|nr:uroporphyrinogen decarboxylase family protein [Clostridia bacterium]